MLLESHKNVPEAISEGLKFKNFLGGACPQIPYREHCHAQSLHPLKFSLSIILPPLSIFLNETLHGHFCIQVQMRETYRNTQGDKAIVPTRSGRITSKVLPYTSYSV